METCFLICGGGITGLTIARALLKRGYRDITIIEKEDTLGRHASGRNSGVLHAGIYYEPESLKARFCLKGNFLMKDYCRGKGLPLAETGKVIVAKDEGEINTLKDLYNKAIKNGTKVELIDEKQLREIEPDAKTCGLALYSYYTAVVDPMAVLENIYKDLVSSGVKVLTGTRFKGLNGSRTASTNRGDIRFEIFINASGAYSDRVAHAFGVGIDYRLVPFKGIYRKLTNGSSTVVRGNIYPVPDIRNPFLGIHFTRNIKGEVYLGPTAIPALGRENYGVLKGIDMEAPLILIRDAVLFFLNHRFREIAFTEPKKYIFRYFFEDARKIVRSLSPGDVIPSNKSGIRPQLVDWRTKELVMDFKVIRDGESIHILNAVSPAFTSSMAFAEFVVSEYIRRQI